MTAGVLGSNIGAGLVVLLGWPLAAVLVAWALGYSFHLARQNSSVLTAGGGMPYPKRIVWAALLAMVTLFTVAIWTYPL